MVLPVDLKHRIESARGPRCHVDRDQWNDNAGVKMRQQIGLAVEDESLAQTVNIKLRHSE
jgi:hypothetical protein